MAECGICLKNPKGYGNTAEICGKEPGQTCNTCRWKCREEATYIGGINVCAGHQEAYLNRIVNNFDLLRRRKVS